MLPNLTFADGQRGAISKDELWAIVADAKRELGDNHPPIVYRIHVLSSSQAEVHYGRPSSAGGAYLIIEKVHGHWQKKDRVIWYP